MSVTKFRECALSDDLLGSIIAAESIADKNEVFECLGNSTILNYAVMQDMPGLVVALIEMGAGVDVKDNLGNTPLLIARRRNNVDLVKIILSKGANVDLPGGEHDSTALYYSVLDRNKKMRDILLSAGANPNVSGNNLYIPLRLSILYQLEEQVSTLIKYGADVNIKTKDGSTPLHWAAQVPSPSIVKTLIESGADVNGMDDSRVTPLMSALIRLIGISQRDPEVLKILLESGANIDHTDNSGRTPLSIADDIGDETILLLLRK